MSETVPLLDIVQTKRQKALSAQKKQSLDERDLIDRAYNQVTADLLLRGEHKEKAVRLKGCGEAFYSKKCRNDGFIAGSVKSFCGENRLCPTCARIRRQEILADISGLIKVINNRPVMGFRWRLLTLTIKTEGRYREAAETALKGFSQLWRGYLKGGRGLPTAAVVHLENAPQTGNVHLHGLFYGPYLNHFELSRRWAKITGSFIVHVKDVRGRDLRRAAGEVLKYMTKFTEVSNEKLVELWRANRRLKLLRRYGLLRKDCLEAWSGEAIVASTKEIKEPICPICGCQDYDYILVNDQGGRAPPLEKLGGFAEIKNA